VIVGYLRFHFIPALPVQGADGQRMHFLEIIVHARKSARHMSTGKPIQAHIAPLGFECFGVLQGLLWWGPRVIETLIEPDWGPHRSDVCQR
jgi:hypothetical protein